MFPFALELLRLQLAEQLTRRRNVFSCQTTDSLHDITSDILLTTGISHLGFCCVRPSALGAGRFPILMLVRPESNRFAERTVPEACCRREVRPFRGLTTDGAQSFATLDP